MSTDAKEILSKEIWRKSFEQKHFREKSANPFVSDFTHGITDELQIIDVKDSPLSPSKWLKDQKRWAVAPALQVPKEQSQQRLSSFWGRLSSVWAAKPAAPVPESKKVDGKQSGPGSTRGMGG